MVRLIEGGVMPHKNPKDDLEAREKDIQDILKLELGTGAEFKSVNIGAWKVAFHKRLRAHKDKKFSFRTIEDGRYEAWRIS